MLQNQIKQENKCLNFFKGLAAIAIVMLHSNFTNDKGVFSYLSTIINCLSRFAVPLFFMISGYFLFSENKETVQKKLPSKIKHILTLCIVATIIYFVWSCLNNCVFATETISFGNYLKNTFTLKKIFMFVVFNQVPMAEGLHLWFLFALLYCYLVTLIINKRNLYKYAYIYAIISLGILFFLQYVMHFIYEIPDSFLRNAFLTGFPFLMIGCFIKQYKDKILQKINSRTALFLILGGLILCLAERFGFYLINKLFSVKDTGYQTYIGCIIASSAMLIYSLHNEQKQFIPYICTVGAKYSLDVYIIHNIILGVFNLVVPSFGSINVYQTVRMVTVIIVSILVSVAFRFILKLLKQKLNAKPQ